MEYLALARKWRPQRFEELVGQEHVVQTLKNAILHKRVVHAYLFSGARGVGKTSVARIFAKALRCPQAKEAIPCEQCQECTSISEGRSVDVVEIDGASNNGVESVRGIRENVAYGASDGKYKIYIIDEVHMLSVPAFNALLKTLEEPPKHVIFVFATTELQKIPMTILSRCQRFEFRRLSHTQIVACLKKILGTESISISEEALRSIASHADGSLRDAQSLLDQVLSYYSGQQDVSLDETQVALALGLSESNTIRDFLRHVVDKNFSGFLKVVKDAHLAGVDLKHFSHRVQEEIRLLYLVCLSQKDQAQFSQDDLDISTSHFEELRTLSKKTTVLQTERMAQILSKAISQLSWSSLPRFVLEMAAVRMAQLDGLSKIEAALLESGTSTTNRPMVPASTRAPMATSAAVPAPNEPPKAAPYVSPSGGKKSWEALVDAVMKKRPLLGALLSHANFKLDTKGEAKKITLAFSQDSFYEKQAVEAKAEITQYVKEFFGATSELNLSNELESTNKSLETQKQEEVAALKKNALEHSEVLKVKSALGADVVDVNLSH